MSAAEEENAPNVFSDNSIRARQTIFIARLQAGSAGAKMIGLDHLVAALVIEDQGKNGMAKLLNVDPGAVGVSVDTAARPIPFFSPYAAALLLKRIDELSPHSEPIPNSADMTLSSECMQILNVAQDIRRQFQSTKVEPLHLLAAALVNPSSKVFEILLEAGIMREKVLEAIQKD